MHIHIFEVVYQCQLLLHGIQLAGGLSN